MVDYTISWIFYTFILIGKHQAMHTDVGTINYVLMLSIRTITCLGPPQQTYTLTTDVVLRAYCSVKSKIVTAHLKSKQLLSFGFAVINPLSPHDALKHHFKFLKTDFIFPQLRVLEGKFPWNYLTNTWPFFSIFHPFQVIFIHCKSRIATAIRGL